MRARFALACALLAAGAARADSVDLLRDIYRIEPRACKSVGAGANV